MINPSPAQLEHSTTCLLLALQARDLETGNHAARVQQIALALGRQMRLSAEHLYALKFGALLHDVGKIATPDQILKKPGPLDPEEWTIMRRHPQTGANLLRAAGYPEAACLIVEQHHERWDGTGYPFGLAGQQIAIGARIFAVADTYDAITRDRCYRPGAAPAVALHEITACSETQFDPDVVTQFLELAPLGRSAREGRASFFGNRTTLPFPQPSL